VENNKNFFQPILYGIDNETGHISPLPASPFLLLSALGFAVLVVIGKVWHLFNSEDLFRDRKVDKKLYKQWVSRYLYLKNKKYSTGLTRQENAEFMNLELPPWRKPHERWQW
jgi:hypothetical protein